MSLYILPLSLQSRQILKDIQVNHANESTSSAYVIRHTGFKLALEGYIYIQGMVNLTSTNENVVWPDFLHGTAVKYHRNVTMV